MVVAKDQVPLVGFWQAVLDHWVLQPALDNVPKIMILSFAISYSEKRNCCFMYECGSFPHKKSIGTDNCMVIITEQPLSTGSFIPMYNTAVWS
jgi:hypothetical protein